MELDFTLLHDIHEGTPPVDYSYGWMWYLLFLVVIWLIGYTLYRLTPLFKAYGRLRQVDIQSKAFIPLINYWLKETSLIMYERDTVAPLYGLQWLRFLDKTGGTNFERFNTVWEQVIYDWQNIELEIPVHEKKLLIKECRKWLFANIRRRLWTH
ncbi:MAG: DUF4381 domain-containing protein [Succinivibrionaceae bacterium]